ncbi:MAG: LptF/LptG family permease [Mariprofundales bacterium]
MITDRYILRLFLVPFLGFVGLVLGLLLLSRALKVLGMVSDSGIPWDIMGQMLWAITPYFLTLALPLGFFFACQHVVSYLHQESELDAFRAAGVSYQRLLRGLVVCAVLLSFFMFYTTMQWMPQGQKAFQGLVFALQQAKPAPGFDAQRFNRDMPDFTVYVDGQDDEGHLHGFILEDNRPGGSVVYIAQTADIARSSGGLHFVLYNGSRIEGGGGTLRTVNFSSYTVNLDLGAAGIFKTPQWTTRIFEMEMLELWSARQQADTPAATAEWHRRLVLPLMLPTLLLFVLPLSLPPKRSGSAGVYIGGAFIALALFQLNIAMHNRVSYGYFPWWSIWLAQSAVMLLGSYLTRRYMQDRAPRLLFSLGEFFFISHQWLRHHLAARWQRRG